MAIRDIFKVSRKTFVNPTSWVDYDALKIQSQFIWRNIKSLFTVTTPDNPETFEEAAQRLELTEADLQASIRRYRQYALGFLIIGILVFVYAFYLLFRYATFTGWLLGIAASGLFLSQAFRFDFWALQIRQRRLGLTFAEWKHHILGDKEASK